MTEISRLPTPLRTDDDLFIPPAERKTMTTIQAHECRWPFGDPLKQDFHFCGKLKADGSPYCEFHTQRAVQASRPRSAVYRPHAA